MKTRVQTNSETQEDKIMDLDDTNELEQDNRVTIKHINAQSITGKIQQLEVEAEGYDFVTISETWLHDEIDNSKLAMEGFNEIARKDRTRDRYGGVAIYGRIEHKFKIRNDLHSPGIESCWVETQINNKNMMIGVIYRPPNEPADYWNHLEEHLEEVKDSGIDTIILTGDLNCDQHIRGNKLQKILDRLHMNQEINMPTHYTGTSATLLDIIATTSADLVEDSAVHPPSLSNHRALQMKLMWPHSHSEHPYGCHHLPNSNVLV